MSALPKAINGRPRGFIDWRPQQETAALIKRVQSILEEYRDYLPLTLRQIFYRLVGNYGYDKTEKAYKRLCEMLNRARRGRLIEFDAIRDDGFTRLKAHGWRGIEHVIDAVENTVNDYRLDRQASQSRKIVVWCEAAGMAPQLRTVCDGYTIPVYSSGGFDSVTVKHSIAHEFASMGNVLVFHIGDHDPSGVHVFGSLDEDIRAFMAGMGGDAEFVRLAVLPEHIEEYGLPTAPPKKSDRRNFHGETVQAEALPPDVLVEILRNRIEEAIDSDLYAMALNDEQRQKEYLRNWLSQIER